MQISAAKRLQWARHARLATSSVRATNYWIPLTKYSVARSRWNVKA